MILLLYTTQQQENKMNAGPYKLSRNSKRTNFLNGSISNWHYPLGKHQGGTIEVIDVFGATPSKYATVVDYKVDKAIKVLEKFGFEA